LRWIFATAPTGGSQADTKIPLSAGTSEVSNAGAGVSGTFKIFNPLGGSAPTRMNGQSGYQDIPSSSSLDLGTVMTGQYTQTTAVNAFQVLSTSGNLTSGTVRCYGLSH
jgi:hypothetical protein